MNRGRGVGPVGRAALVDHRGRPLVQEDTYEADATEVGLAELLKHDPVPPGSLCTCGDSIPWDKVRATRQDAAVEIEVRHHCGAVYVIRAGSMWRWTV